VLERLGSSHSERINTFVVDMINETNKNLKEGININIYQSDEIFEAMNVLRNFMFKNVYYGELCSEEEKKAEFIVESLYRYFLSNPKDMPPKYYANISKEGLERSVTDFIATCTDSYATEIFQDKFIPFRK